MTIPADTIFVLSTPSCQRCKTVARHLDANGIAYEYVDLAEPDNADWVAEMETRNLKNVPQTFRGEGDWIEGVDFGAINRLF